MCLPRSLARLCLSPYPDPLNYISTTNKPAVQGKSIDAAAASAAAEASALHIVDRPSPDSRARSLSGPELFTGFPTAHRFGRMYAAVLMRSVKSLNSKMNSVASATGGVFVCIYEQLCRVLYKKEVPCRTHTIASTSSTLYTSFHCKYIYRLAGMRNDDDRGKTTGTSYSCVPAIDFLTVSRSHSQLDLHTAHRIHTYSTQSRMHSIDINTFLRHNN